MSAVCHGGHAEEQRCYDSLDVHVNIRGLAWLPQDKRFTESSTILYTVPAVTDTRLHGTHGSHHTLVLDMGRQGQADDGGIAVHVIVPMHPPSLLYAPHAQRHTVSHHPHLHVVPPARAKIISYPYCLRHELLLKSGGTIDRSTSGAVTLVG